MSYAEMLRKANITYLGNVAQSMKMRLSYENGTMTYCLYLAPYNMSGYVVCPNAEYCKDFCLNASGRNKIGELTSGIGISVIDNARIRKTRLFYEDRETFMHMLVYEIAKWRARAKKLGMGFSVRLNGTSDLSPILFKCDNGENVLEMFDDVQFYDYTKVPSRYNLLERYPNYDLTFSYNGHNAEECERFINNGGKVAVVFYGKKMPRFFCGYEVVDGNLYDMRYLDPNGTVIGLHYHVTSKDYVMNEFGRRMFKEPNTPFVVMPNDPRCEW